MSKSVDVILSAVKSAGEAALRLHAENEALQEQNNRLLTLKLVLTATIHAHRTLLLEMRQHQGSIQPYVMQIDALLNVNAVACDRCNKALVNGRGGCEGAQHGNNGCAMNSPTPNCPHTNQRSRGAWGDLETFCADCGTVLRPSFAKRKER
jgi:hypothetical protein